LNPHLHEQTESSFCRFLAGFHKPVKKSSLVLFAFFLVCICAIRGYAGLDGMNSYSHDLFVSLDGGWRVLNGQIPYVTFFTDVGTFVHVQTALGLLLAHGHAQGVAYAQALTGCALGIWAYALAARRLSPVFAILFVLIVVLFTVSPSLIGDPAGGITAACLYNRYGYALAALLILEAFYAAPPASRFSPFLGGFSSGAIAALLLFTKISYFLGVGFLLVAMWPCRQQLRLRWFGIAAGFAIVFLPFWLYMQRTLLPMWSSLRLLAEAKHLSILPFTLPPATSASCQMGIVASLAVALLWRDGALSDARRLAIASFAVLAVGAFFLLTNYQHGRVPLLPILGLLIVQQVESRFRSNHREKLLLRTALVLWTCVFIVGSITLDSASLGHALGVRLRGEKIDDSTFNSPRLSGFQDYETWYVALVNDGIGLLQKYRHPSDTVASLDFSNPFSYALGIAPPRGGTPTGLQYRTNFDDDHHLSPEFLFGRATLVMVPETFTDVTLQQTIPRIYGPYLHKNFHLVGQTASWRLYRVNR
jgi:hypothetical protein